jgi:LacI family transcriptional regulator
MVMDVQTSKAKATISDVSRLSGVSIKTVSRVLNGERYVSDALRDKVQAAVAELAYRPNFAARALAGKRSFQIALIYDNPSPYFAQNIQAGVMARCAQQGYRMIALPCDAGSPNMLSEIAALIDQAQLDGVILTAPITEDAAVRAMLAERKLPFAMISPAQVDGDVASASIDQAAAAQAMVAFLISAGHRRIAFIGGSKRFATSARRLAGYRAALGKAGIVFDPTLVREGDYDFASGSSAAEALLALPSPPGAIFASSDDMAAGVLATAHRLGIDVPGQLSVAGFDNTDLAAVVWPPLTTVSQPVRDLAYAATDLLLSGKTEHVQLDFELVSRGSVGRG